MTESPFHSHEYRGEVPLHDQYGPEARYAVEAEALIPQTAHEREIARGLELGLQGADSIVDRTIPTFSRGELPHFAGINTFLKAPYLEDVRECGAYDVSILGAPYDGGTTYRPGTRFGPQGIRKISALYGPRFALLLAVDDATGAVVHALFGAVEDARGYFLLMEQVLRRSGVPLALYNDRHAVFRASAQQRAGGEASTQFARAMAELGVRLIFARSPQPRAGWSVWRARSRTAS